MLRFKCNPVLCCSTIAIWTIIQTGLHLYAIIYLIWFTDCNSVENTSNNVLYLTYFFTRKCGNETLHNLESRNLVNILNTPISDQPDINGTLDKMILVYIILDCLWIVASVAVLTATLLDIRELWALFFYVPWIVIATVVVLFDTFCAIFFGLQIPSDGNFFDWLNFIGIGFNISENIQKLEGDMTSLVTGASSIIMTFVSSRGVIIWLINLIAIVYIIKITIKHSKKKPPPRQRSARRNASFSAQERIKKWHQFYESTEESSQESIASSSNSNTNGDERRTRNTGSVSSISNSFSNTLRKGSEISNNRFITRGVISPESRKRLEQISLGELRGQLPWSYFDGRQTGGQPDVVPDKTYMKLSDVDEAISQL